MQLSRRQTCTTLGALLSLSILSPLTAAAPRIIGTRDRSEFLGAVRTGDLDKVRRMLAENAELARATDEAGRSALVLAFVHGQEAIAALLQEAGLELDIVEAVLAGDWDRFDELGKAHPELLERSHPVGGTPLYGAALVGSHQAWRVRALGCDPDAAPRGGTGFTPARGAMESTNRAWARIALMDLCSNGGDVNAKQKGGSSVLHGAVMRRDETLVRLAIRKGAEVTAVDDQGRTAQALAAELDWTAGVHLLADHGGLAHDNRSSRFALDANREPVVRPDLSDVSRATQTTVTNHSHFNLDKLTEMVATDERLIFSVSGDDELAIEACAHIGSRPIIRYHLDHGAPLSLPTAVSLGDFDSVEFWLKHDPSLVHERGAHDFPVMWYAVLGGGSVEMAELLAHYKVPLDQESVGTTTLHWCVRRGDRDLIKWLIEQGADPEPVGFRWSREGQTPLQVAMADDLPQMVSLLKGLGVRH